MHQAGRGVQIFQVREVLLHALLQMLSFTRLASLQKYVQLTPVSLLDRRQGPLHRIMGQQHLSGRAYPHLLDALHRALGDRVEQPDTIYLIAHQLDPHRELKRRRRDIHDSAAHRVLAHIIYEIHTLIAQIGQTESDAVTWALCTEAKLHTVGHKSRAGDGQSGRRHDAADHYQRISST